MSDNDENGRANPTWGMPEQPVPPPQQPPYGQPAHPPQQAYGSQPSYGGPPPGYYPPQKSNKGLIIGLSVGLGVLVLVGLVLLIVWLSGGLGGSSSSSSSRTGSTTSTTSTTGESSGGSSFGGVSEAYLVGTWGPNCPGSGGRRVTFTENGYVTGGGGTGTATWSLSGNTVAISQGGRTMRQAITYIDDNTFTDGRETIHRC